MNIEVATNGFQICRGVLDEAQILMLRKEANSIAKTEGSACVRHLRARSEIFNTLSVSSSLLSILPVGMRPVRSILFDKTKTENWPVRWHQDLTIAVRAKRSIEGYGPWSIKDGATHVEPPVKILENMITIRLHLDDTPEANGALRVIPGSHKAGKIPSSEVNTYVHHSSVTCKCKTGDALLMSPLILHSSRRSKSPARRRVLHFEYARLSDIHPTLEWLEANKSPSTAKERCR